MYWYFQKSWHKHCFLFRKQPLRQFFWKSQYFLTVLVFYERCIWLPVFGQFCFCCCWSLLLQLACSIHATWSIDFCWCLYKLEIFRTFCKEVLCSSGISRKQKVFWGNVNVMQWSAWRHNIKIERTLSFNWVKVGLRLRLEEHWVLIEGRLVNHWYWENIGI